jgi:hypothetical protein
VRITAAAGRGSKSPRSHLSSADSDTSGACSSVETQRGRAGASAGRIVYMQRELPRSSANRRGVPPFWRTVCDWLVFHRVADKVKPDKHPRFGEIVASVLTTRNERPKQAIVVARPTRRATHAAPLTCGHDDALHSQQLGAMSSSGADHRAIVAEGRARAKTGARAVVVELKRTGKSFGRMHLRAM